MKRVIIFALWVLFVSACTEFESLDGPCTVFLKETDEFGNQLSYVIDQDVRRNKKTGVFTYRELLEDGRTRLWSIMRESEPDDQGVYRYFSKSQEGGVKEVDFVQCGDVFYLLPAEDDKD
ncbi:hypothetical protein [Belliella pelovolcani]|uniref:hypothetical protein n=1 Tax=Belliella pelovolcani TaxID=529505 RepID=UPI00391A0750